MRIIAALVACLCATAAAWADPPPSVGGDWRAEQTASSLSTPNYFVAELTEHDGVLHGAGFVNLCAGCRGWEQYDVTWEGRLDGDRVELRGAPDRPYEPEVRFSGHLGKDGRIRGTLASSSDRAATFVMVRGNADDDPAARPSVE